MEMRNKSPLMFAALSLVLFASCAHQAKEVASDSGNPSSSRSSSLANNGASQDKMKEMSQEEFNRSAAESMAKLREQIEVTAFQKDLLKADKNMSWKCTALSGERKFTKSAQDPMVAKNNAQKACESKKNAASCFVSECVPKRL
jgi:hypothetical protein